MWAYLAADLHTSETEALEGHLSVCKRCCGELEFSRHLRELVAETGGRPMPPAVRSTVEELLAAADGGPGESR